MQTEPADETLMRALGAGHTEALGTLFQRHHAGVYAYCARLTLDREAAADLVQDTFLRVLRYRDSFTRAHDFKPWLLRVARNACRDFAARRHGQQRSEARWLAESMADPGENAPRDAQLEHALARLPAADRDVLVLKRFHDLTYAELAAVLGCREGAARVRVHRALRRLQEIMRTSGCRP